MPSLRRPRLVWAALLAAAGYVIGRHWRGGANSAAPAPPPSFPERDVSPAAAKENRIDALTKLKGLRDEGVLTEEQYRSERRRLTTDIG